MTSKELGKSEGPAALPPDGSLIYVSQWRKQLNWAFFGWFALLNLSVSITIFLQGKVAGIILGAVGLSLAVFSLRIPMTGLLLGAQGVTLRTALWTYRWTWHEIDHFELKSRGYIPRLRIHLTDGRVKRAKGFFARGPSEEERCHALFAALEERLKGEQAHSSEC